MTSSHQEIHRNRVHFQCKQQQQLLAKNSIENNKEGDTQKNTTNDHIVTTAWTSAPNKSLYLDGLWSSERMWRFAAYSTVWRTSWLCFTCIRNAYLVHLWIYCEKWRKIRRNGRSKWPITKTKTKKNPQQNSDVSSFMLVLHIVLFVTNATGNKCSFFGTRWFFVVATGTVQTQFNELWIANALNLSCIGLSHRAVVCGRLITCDEALL